MLHWIDLLTGYIGPARRTVAVLIAANLLPLLLVASGLWSLQQVMLLYWLENGVIGVWDVAKMLRSGWPPFSLRLFRCIFVPAFRWFLRGARRISDVLPEIADQHR